MRASYRLYKLTALSGLLLAAPVVIGVGWYAWSAYADLDRYRRELGSKAPPLDLELFHVALHDQLARDWRRLTLPERPANSKLPTYAIAVGRHPLDAMNREVGEQTRSWVKGHLMKDGQARDVEVRYRGGQPWHFLGPQKSMKLKLDRGDLLDGTRVFNLLNDPTPFGLEDQIVLDISRELGLLTPEYHPAWVRLNNSDLGVFRYAAQPNEGLLRRGRRMPGRMYSGDREDERSLYADASGWQKVALRVEDEPLAEMPELARLLDAVNRGSHADFAAWAERELDLDRYALFDALDVVFGGNDHDWLTNHKLYADPYTGKLEPVAWSYRGFQHEPYMNLVEHPLLLRLALTPGWLARRNRAVYELLHGAASVPAVRARADAAFEALAPDLAADPYWDAYKQLPRASRFMRFMVRPMSSESWLLAAEGEIAGFSRRSRFLLDRLERPGIAARWRPRPGGAVLVATLSGEAAHTVNEVVVHGACAGAWRLRADADGDSTDDPRRDVEAARGAMGESGALAAWNELGAAVELVARPDADAKSGPVRSARVSEEYVWFVSAPCAPDAIVLLTTDRIGSGALRLVATRDDALTLVPRPARAAEVPSLAAGVRSPHPWELPPSPAPAVVELGPGMVDLPTGRVFGAHETVVVAAGTRLLLGNDASLVFHGKVDVRGTAARPVRLMRRAADLAFGGVALQGRGTAGSRLRHLHIEGGSRVRGARVDYPGTLNVHDTRDIALEGLRITGSGGPAASDPLGAARRDGEAAGAEPSSRQQALPDDLVHVTYVTGLRLFDVEVSAAPVDAIDIEISSGELRGIRIAGAGDDCLDLMTADLLVADAVLYGCTNNAVSAGEETELRGRGLFVADARIGVLAKNASRVSLSRSLLYRVGTAFETRKKEVHYAGASGIRGHELFAVDCDNVVEAARAAPIEAGHVITRWPAPGSLDHLLEQVLGLGAWSEVEPLYAARGGEP